MHQWVSESNPQSTEPMIGSMNPTKRGSIFQCIRETTHQWDNEATTSNQWIEAKESESISQWIKFSASMIQNQRANGSMDHVLMSQGSSHTTKAGSMKQPFKESTAKWMQCVQSNRHLHHWSKSTDYGFINPMNLNQCMSETMSLWANEIRLHA